MTTNNRTRKAIYMLSDIFKQIKDGRKKTSEGFRLKRLKIFYFKGCDCISCDRQGQYFALEQDSGGAYHIDLYGKDPDGTEFLMTRDHIIPKSKGGNTTLDNLQPMCENCNQKKGNK